VTMHGAFSLFFLCFHVLYLAHPFSKILMSWQVCGSGDHRVIFSPLCKEKITISLVDGPPFLKVDVLLMLLGWLTCERLEECEIGLLEF
jgi:hypothetical protein